MLKSLLYKIKSWFFKPAPKAKDIVVDPITLPNETPKAPSKEPVIVEVPVHIDTENDGSTRNPDWTYLWDNMKITPSKHLDQTVAKILANKDKYIKIEMMTGVPWKWIAAIHYRESSLDFTKYLGNGQPLNRVTTWVPKGRGPFSSFEDGAIDAIRYDKIDKADLSTYPKMCSKAQDYNGRGYLSKSIYTPYVWSGTNWYTRGKYTSDGIYNPFKVDSQLGVAPILKRLEKSS